MLALASGELDTRCPERPGPHLGLPVPRLCSGACGLLAPLPQLGASGQVPWPSKEAALDFEPGARPGEGVSQHRPP